jgi:prepilin-type processing-associated H-X9-DG protein
MFLIGPTRILPPSSSLSALHSAFNRRIAGLIRADVTTKSALLALVGDNNWMHEWDPRFVDHSIAWHGKPQYHNLAFLDGHVDFLKIRKGLYVTPEYSILPFEDLLEMARDVQQEIP